MPNHIQPPLKEYLKGIPGLVGIRLDEEPNYHRREKLETFEVRDYPQVLAATFSFVGKYEEFCEVAFPHLADYIFGNEIPMTIPVTIENIEDQWKMSLLLPKKIKARNAPAPANKAVVLEALPPRTVVVHKFTGDHTLDVMRIEAGMVERKFQAHSKYTPTGPAMWAFYDAPYTVSFMKRNEVWLPVHVQGV